MTAIRINLVVLGSLLFFSLVNGTLALEKVKIGTSVRVQPLFILPPIAAQEKGFWREEGLEGEWISFASAVVQGKAIVAGELAVVITITGQAVIYASQGVPIVIVADIGGLYPWWVWVRQGSPVKEEKDLGRARFAITRLGSLDYAYTRAILKGLGLPEKEVKFIGMGGTVEKLAGLKAGLVDAVVLSEFTMARLENEGIARKLVSLTRFVPRDWDPLTVSATRAFVENSPETLKKMNRAILKAGQYILANPEWSIEKIKKEIGYSQPIAEKVYKLVNFSKDGRIYPERIKVMREFLIAYGLVVAEKTPPLEALYTDNFVPVR